MDVVFGPEQPVTLGRTSGPGGEVLLRRRGSVEELVVDGVFAMDSAETSSELELGRLASGATRVLVGGLGLGYTVAAVLQQADASPSSPCPVAVDVVELEPALVGWARSGLTPTLHRVGADPRVRLHVADVAAVLAGRAGPVGPWDAILLDVDNGPDFLLHPANDALYGEAGVRAAYERLAPGGTLAVWCQGPAPALLAAMRQVAPPAQERRYAVQRGTRSFSYVICTLTRSGAGREHG